MTTAVENIKARGEALRRNAEARRIQARKEIPDKYHGYIIDLDQKVKLADFEAEALKNAPGFAVYGGKTYAEVSLPYVAVDGRIRMAVDDHQDGQLNVAFETAWTREAKELLVAASHAVLDAEAMKALLASVPDGLKNILVCVAVSSKRGTVEGSAKIGWDGSGVDRTNPFENAQTSAYGRALGNMGYGLLGGGVASYEEVSTALKEQEGLDRRPAAPPAPSPKPAPEPKDTPASPPDGTTTPPVASESPTPEGAASDPALQQTEGPCEDCGKELPKAIQSYIRNNRKKSVAVRWVHSAVPGGKCPSA